MDKHEIPELEMVDLMVGYGGRPVVTGVSAAIPRSARVGLVGPNGAGKSTLFKALVGLIQPSKGYILYSGHPASRRLDCIAYVPQRQDIDWRFPVTVQDVVLMGRYGKLGWLRRAGREDRQIARRCLEELSIAHLANRQIGELSGGQQQRVFLARALAAEPSILMLDEPFAGVDIPTQEAVLALLNELSGRGITVLVSTHDLGSAAVRFDLLMLLNRRLIAFGSPAEVLTAQNLVAAFGSQVLIYQEGSGVVAIADRCCPPGTECFGCGGQGEGI